MSSQYCCFKHALFFPRHKSIFLPWQGPEQVDEKGDSIAFLTLSLRHCRLIEEVSLALQKLATATGRDSALRCAALEVLALLAFALTEDAVECERIREGLFKLAGSEGTAFNLKLNMLIPLTPDKREAL